MNTHPEVIRKRAVRNVPVRKHVNKITLQGMVITDVRVKRLKSGTESCVFKIISRETFQSKGKTNWHDNEVVIEALGSQARVAQRLIKKNKEYIFDGYLRTDIISKEGVSYKRMRVRIYHIDTL
jgi:single-stranded DNA-binding protein